MKIYEVIQPNKTQIIPGKNTGPAPAAQPTKIIQQVPQTNTPTPSNTTQNTNVNKNELQTTNQQSTEVDADEEQLEELSFLGSPCTKDCSGHRAGYEWYKKKQRPANSWSQSFNNGANLAQQGK